MEHVRWLADPDKVSLTNPVVVAAFTGWNDAGDAASTALRTLIDTGKATPLAEIDPEPFTDFATVRPRIRLDHDRNRTISWPTVGIWAASLPGTDVVLILGPEPALRWRLFCEQLTSLTQRVNAHMMITLGALLADVPHTRATQIIGTATDAGMIDRFDLERSRYEGPTGIVGVLHDAFNTTGLPTASLWAAVPGYASQLSSPRAAMALIDRACAMMGTPPPISELSGQVAGYDGRIAAMIADDDDLETYVSRLEDMIDEMNDDDDVLSESDSGDSGKGILAAEIEQFLRDRSDEAT